MNGTFSRAAAGVLTVALVFGGTVLSGGTPADAASKTATLKVGTFNVRQYTVGLDAINAAKKAGKKTNEKPWETRRTVIAAQINAAGLDVVGIQEASPFGKTKGWTAVAPQACKNGASTVGVVTQPAYTRPAYQDVRFFVYDYYESKWTWDETTQTSVETQTLVPGHYDEDIEGQEGYWNGDWVEGYLDSKGVYYASHEEYKTWVPPKPNSRTTDYDGNPGFWEYGAYVNGVWTPSAWNPEQAFPEATEQWKCSNYTFWTIISQRQDLVNQLGGTWKDTGGNGADFLVYKSNKLEVVKQGWKDIATEKIKSQQLARGVSWAVFRQKATGRQFFVISTHLNPYKSAKIRKQRVKQAKQILALIKKNNTGNLPVILTGDLSETARTHADDAAHMLISKLKWTDAISKAKKKVNPNLCSVQDWRRKPWSCGNQGHVDYVLYKKGNAKTVTVLKWANVMNLKNGKVVGVIPSDHTLITATLKFSY
ncbi:MAG: hypothetical protein LBR32_03210 [Propionibacteriaceae bacterium]|jgi:endonuclease/exonuclease/phosphatase family metal-dependent hydrolase|nr:hypothetical protein [Propionibacteriaceae bacterium]